MPILSFLVFALLGVLAGACLATQAAVNAELGKTLSSPSAAAFVSYIGARSSWGWYSPSEEDVMISISLVPRLGSATVLSLFVLGQMVASVTFDNFALLGLQQRPADLGRVIGAGLVVLGVLLMRR